ncbi:MAG: acyl carrier protein [Synergistaceae bacterium]|nr:acyl carrier protein [Synergistaceae bacterium]
MQEEIMRMLLEIRPEINFRGSSDFIEDGLLDSLDVISLVSKLEEKYGIEIDGMEIVPENFCGIKQIEKLVISHKA